MTLLCSRCFVKKFEKECNTMEGEVLIKRLKVEESKGFKCEGCGFRCIPIFEISESKILLEEWRYNVRRTLERMKGE